MKHSIDHVRFCPEHYEEIKNYELAKADNFEGWVCHHRNGEEFTKEWLIANNMYWNRTDPFEFIFLPTRSDISKRTGIPTHKAYHAKTKIGIEASKRQAAAIKGKPGHKHTEEYKKHMSDIMKGKPKSPDAVKKLAFILDNSMTNVKTEFSKKYREHYGISKRKNVKLYNVESYFYRVHGYCSWEEKLK